MHPENLAILKGLVCVAWADGHVAAAEAELIEGLLQAFAATPSEAVEIREFAAHERSLDDIPIHDLGYNDRRVLLSQSVVLSFADGQQHERERKMIQDLCRVLRIPTIEADGIVRAAEDQARSLLPLLKQ
jgi:tellurite resistance protein